MFNLELKFITVWLQPTETEMHTQLCFSIISPALITVEKRLTAAHGRDKSGNTFLLPLNKKDCSV